jgi:hypothetical protein
MDRMSVPGKVEELPDFDFAGAWVFRWALSAFAHPRRQKDRLAGASPNPISERAITDFKALNIYGHRVLLEMETVRSLILGGPEWRRNQKRRN